jgi:hypothetical protein
MTFLTSAGTTSLSLTLLAASLANAIVMLDATVVNVAMERIKDSLGTDVTGLQWVISAYMLVFASFLLTGGALGDRFGVKRVFVAGFALFTAASFGCGIANNITTLIAARPGCAACGTPGGRRNRRRRVRFVGCGRRGAVSRRRAYSAVLGQCSLWDASQASCGSRRRRRRSDFVDISKSKLRSSVAKLSSMPTRRTKQVNRDMPVQRSI